MRVLLDAAQQALSYPSLSHLYRFVAVHIGTSTHPTKVSHLLSDAVLD